MAKCAHKWKLLEFGDDGLTCMVCGRYLGYANELTDNRKTQIIKEVIRRLGVADVETFALCLEASQQDWKNLTQEEGD